MSELLTTKELQALLRVDRITIYRMLEQGRLPGFKVGGQWRFSRRDIEQWLDAQREDFAAPLDEATAASQAASDFALPLHCMEAMHDVFAEAVDMACVTVSPEGEPLTSIYGCSEFCAVIRSTEEGRRRCSRSWREMAEQASEGKPLRECHAGLSYAAGPVIVGGATVAVTLGGQVRFSPAEGEDWEARCRAVAAACGLEADDLLRASGTIRVCEPEWAPRARHLVRRLADTFSQIGEERLSFLSRLQRIAEITKV